MNHICLVSACKYIAALFHRIVEYVIHSFGDNRQLQTNRILYYNNEDALKERSFIFFTIKKLLIETIRKGVYVQSKRNLCRTIALLKIVFLFAYALQKYVNFFTIKKLLIETIRKRVYVQLKRNLCRTIALRLFFYLHMHCKNVSFFFYFYLFLSLVGNIFPLIHANVSFSY